MENGFGVTYKWKRKNNTGAIVIYAYTTNNGRQVCWRWARSLSLMQLSFWWDKKKRTLADTHGERDYVDTSAQKLKSSTRKRKREITRETGTVNNVQWMGTVRCWASFQLKHSRRAVCLWDHLCAHCKFCSGPAPFSDVKTNQPGKSDKITSRTLSLTWPECFNDLCVFLDSNEVATNKTETEPKPKQNRK